MNRDTQALLKDFELTRSNYEMYASTVCGLIGRLLAGAEISVHSISFRCKTVKSLERKILKKSGYPSLDKITDLAGVRIITHYSDDVDKVAALVESEFLIDRDNSIDKRIALDPDRFGYLSLHYVGQMSSARTELKEYSLFKDLKLEIQIRSILQHTWAEIEHDIGYKSTVEVPHHLRRRFSRLAGLLEIADQEFISIRDELDAYSRGLQLKTAGPVEELMIDKITYTDFVLNDEYVRELDREIAEKCRYELDDSVEPEWVLSFLEVLGVRTIQALKELLISERKYIIERSGYVEDIRKASEVDGIHRGLGVFFLVQVLFAKTQDQSLIEKYTEENNWSKEFVTILLDYGHKILSDRAPV